MPSPLQVGYHLADLQRAAGGTQDPLVGDAELPALAAKVGMQICPNLVIGMTEDLPEGALWSPVNEGAEQPEADS